MSETVRWYERLSLRLRMMAISAAMVAVVLAVGGVLLLALLRAELLDTADDAGEDTAEGIAALAQQGLLPATLTSTEELAAAVQVVKSGQVISSTSNSFGRDVFPADTPEPGVMRIDDRERLPIDEDGPFRIVSLGTQTPTGDATVHVAVDVEDVSEVVAIASQLGSIGLLVLVLVMSGVLWIVIGRTLAPVTAIRERADAITGSELHRRVPEPVGEDEIADLARTINQMLGRLEDSARRQEAFVADAAHELRSPIASLQARLETELLSASPSDDDQVTRDLLQETIRMGRLVDHLLLLARSDAGTISADRVPVDLDDVIREAVASASATIPVSTSDVEPVQVLGQPGLLGHVVTNLLENADRYARETIDVSLRPNGQFAILTVDDDGPGIPEEFREDVMQRFVRVDESRERGTGGAGLGLAIVSEIVHTHDGEIDVSDSPAGGARLRVLLPLG